MGGRISGERPWRRYPRVVQVPQPAAGADWSVTVPSARVWRLLTVTAQLVTSATVASRAAFLAASDGSTTYVKVPPQGTQAASLTNQYTWWRDAPDYTASSALVQPIPELTLWPGYTLASTTTAIDTADQWSGIVLFVIETLILPGDIDISDLPELVVQIAPGGMGGAAG